MPPSRSMTIRTQNKLKSDHDDEAGHDRLPMPSGVAGKRTGDANAENRQAQFNPINVGMIVRKRQQVHQKIAEHQPQSQYQAELGVPVIEIVIVVDETLFVGRIDE